MEMSESCDRYTVDNLKVKRPSLPIECRSFLHTWSYIIDKKTV